MHNFDIMQQPNHIDKSAILYLWLLVLKLLLLNSMFIQLSPDRSSNMNIYFYYWSNSLHSA